MIRQPSTTDQLLAWHTASIAGEEPPRHDSHPECGWFKIQLTKNGPWTPVTVWCDQDIDEETGELTGPEILRADVFGEEMPAEEICTWLVPISQAEHDRLYQWRLQNQHKLDNKRAVDLIAAPTLPGE